MEPNELDEFQGFRVEDLCAWLTERGWRNDVTNSPGIWRHDALWDRSIGIPRDTRISESLKWRWLFLVAEAVGLSLQELLRQVNPRMRKGWPSEDDLKAHDRWLVRFDGAMAVWGSERCESGKANAPDASVECWPVDAAGNKVRWKGIS